MYSKKAILKWLRYNCFQPHECGRMVPTNRNVLRILKLADMKDIKLVGTVGTYRVFKMRGVED